MNDFLLPGRRANLKIPNGHAGYADCVKLVEARKLDVADWRWDATSDALWVNINCYWERQVIASRSEADNQKGR